MTTLGKKLVAFAVQTERERIIKRLREIALGVDTCIPGWAIRQDAIKKAADAIERETAP